MSELTRILPNDNMQGQLRRDDLVYPELSYKLIGILFEVHKNLGSQYQEKYYQRAIAIALKEQGIPFAEQVLVNLNFKGASIGRYFVDFLIADKIVLEIKTVSRLTLGDYKQVDGYLKALDKELAILVNFRTHNLTFRRVLNSAKAVH